MKRISCAALLAVSLLACGGSNDAGTNPPPAPLPPIVRLELAASNVLIFTGSAVPGAAFVAHAYDATGTEVRDPVLTLTAGAGWTVRGDTLIAPISEGTSTLRISARRAQATTADWMHLSGTTTDTAATDSIAVTAAIDLRAYHWTAEWSCGWDRYGQVPDSNGVYVDSSQYRNVTADSVAYPGDSSWVVNFGGVAQMWLSGTVYHWRTDGAIDTVQFSRRQGVIAMQAPDTLFLSVGYSNPDDPGLTAWDGTQSGPLDRWPAVLTDSTSGRIYVGGNWCSSGNNRHSDVTLTGTP